MMREASRQRIWETRKWGDNATPYAHPTLVWRRPNPCGSAPGVGVATAPRAGSTRQQPDMTDHRQTERT
jgi:hypothetical protein